MRLRPSQLGFWVLGTSADLVSAEEAARAVRDYVRRKRAGLAEALRIEPRGEVVVVRTEGEYPAQMLRELKDLLDAGRRLHPTAEIEVDPGEFTIEVVEQPPEGPEEGELLRSRVRYFPHPVCEWFEVSTGYLTLTERRVLFEPEWQITREEDAGPEGEHRIPLASVERFWRGQWWDVPCLMLQVRQRVYRYGWPDRRGELETIFDVDEWLAKLGSIFEQHP